MFLVNGTAESIVTAELSNWNGKAVKIPRIEVADCMRKDIQEPGVYFLFCKDDENNKDSVYIGEAENVKERLLQHLRDATTEQEKYYWNTALIFVGRDLNKALIRYLENRLVELALASNRYDILTKNTYKNTVLKESQIAAMEEFLENIKVLINTLGYKVLEPLRQGHSGDGEEEKFLYLKTGKTDAVGAVTAEGFVVLAGAKINAKSSDKSLSKGMAKLRQKHFDAGHVSSDLVTTEDILFSSSSSAAIFVTGYSMSGPAHWKDKNGKTLKEIESE
ncbi:GIY-YIG nuclease family protein [Fretibacterium fastidiosum]|nr:GIY-YIG nuclease family protein [Fretibacterium fastidiosum]